MSNYSHVFQEFRPIVEQSNEDRLYFLEEDRWIGYPAANDLLDQLKGFLTLPKRSRMPNGTYGSAFCLLQRLCFSRRTLTPFPLLPDGPPAGGPEPTQARPCTRPAQ